MSCKDCEFIGLDRCGKIKGHLIPCLWDSLCYYEDKKKCPKYRLAKKYKINRGFIDEEFDRKMLDLIEAGK